MHRLIIVIGPNPDEQMRPFYEEDEDCVSPKWDWYSVGGRYRGFLRIKPEQHPGTWILHPQTDQWGEADDAYLQSHEPGMIHASWAMARAVDWEATGAPYGVLADGVWRERPELEFVWDLLAGGKLTDEERAKWHEESDRMWGEWTKWWLDFAGNLGETVEVTVMDVHQ